MFYVVLHHERNLDIHVTIELTFLPESTFLFILQSSHLFLISNIKVICIASMSVMKHYHATNHSPFFGIQEEFLNWHRHYLPLNKRVGRYYCWTIVKLI